MAGEEILTLTEWLELLAGELVVPSPFVLQLPMDGLRCLAGFECRLPLPMRPLLDLSRAIKDLGYRSTPPEKWLPATVAWWRSSGLTSRFWEHRPKEIEALRRARRSLELA